MLQDTLPEYIEIETGPEPRFAVIWLHGLGADGGDFEPLVPELRIPPETPVRFVFPHAPQRAITVNAGMVMRGWYDITGTEMVRHEDSEGIEASARIVRALIDEQQQRGIPAERIVLAGFSQGGAIVLYTGLRYPEPLAGILALSTYLPLASRTAAEVSDANRRIPIFMGHGLYDPLIVVPLAESSRAHLDGLDYAVDWHTYAMPHSVCPQEIDDVGRWLRARIEQGN